jgi:X-Pro dipeptidyl-peptidase
MAGKVALGALVLAAFGFGGTAQAADPVITVGADGKTAPVFSYKDSVKERVWIPVAGVDQDNDGVIDRVAIDIERPAESGPGLKVPAIIDDSPYYTSLGRGNETQYIHTTAAGVLDKFPLFYDNYFVPRGYAFIAAQAVGTAFSTGCPLHGGPGDVAGFKAVVDWLNGRVPGYTSVNGDTLAAANWHNGSSAMIGKSYDGTFANGVAATGVEGLKTIVPVSAISAWYNYSRTSGIRHNTNYPASLSNSITQNVGANQLGVLPPSRNALCAGTRTAMSADTPDGDGDDTGDINNFWQARDYNKDVSKVKASVFATHGFQDDNVRMDHEWLWWNGLKANGVERKLWLLRAGHTDPFESNRAKWVDTLHRWFDHYLQGFNNGIQNEPKVTIEDQKDVWKDYADWPIPGTQNVDLYLRGTSQAAAGTLGGMSGGSTDSVTFTDLSSQSETTMMNTPDGSQANRRVFISQPLKKDIRLSGQGMIDLMASISKTQNNMGAVLVDYGQATQVSRSGEGISNTTTRTCWGPSSDGTDCTLGSTCTANSAVDNACYLEVSKPTQNVTQWRVSRGVLDSSNRTSLWYADASPVTIDQKYRFGFPLMATEHVFAAGHRLGIVIVGTYSSYTGGTTGSVFTVDTKASKVTLPLVGGYKAAVEAGITDPETVAPELGAMPADISTTTTTGTGKTVTFTLPTATDNEDPNPVVTCDPASGSNFVVGTTTVTCVATDANGNVSAPKTFAVTVVFTANGTVGGSVPATLSLTLGAQPSFGALTAGIAKDYTAQTTAGVISTAANAALSVADPSSTATGHLVNGAFSLPSALQANAGGPFADVGGSAAPTLLKSWTAPTSNEAVTVAFQQHVGANDALRTGTYSKTLTFTLSTTAP